MGTINVIARRRKDGVIEFGWHGNWIHYKNTGKVIYDWYRSGYMVDYLFSLGQVANLSEPLSETFDVRGADYRTCPIGTPYWTTSTEREIFSRSHLAEAAYFFDLDGRWYYITTWPLRVKLPLELIVKNLGSLNSEDFYLKKIERMVAKYVLAEWPKKDAGFADLIGCVMSDGRLQEKEWHWGRDKQIEAIIDARYPLYRLRDDWGGLLDYFDDWVVVVPDVAYKDVKEILLRKASPDRDETICWPGHPLNAVEPYMNPYIEGYRDECIVNYLRDCVGLCDRIVNSESADGLAQGQQMVNPRCLVPEEFLALNEDDMGAAKKLLNKYFDRLENNNEFAAVSEMARQCGENKFMQMMKEGEAIWLRR